MGLSSCQNTLIGNEFKRGVSGGERKRTSIAYELISDPNIIMIDEPTTGMDSFTSLTIIKLLKRLATMNNKTISKLLLILSLYNSSTKFWYFWISR